MKYLLAMALVVLFGCTAKDEDIKQSIAANAKEELMFAGLNYNIRKGIVTLNGNCPSEELRNKVVKRIEAIGGVKKVVSNIAIGPVVLDYDFVLKQKVDSVLASYAMVQAQVRNGVVVLGGETKQEKASSLIEALSKLSISGIVNNLSIK